MKKLNNLTHILLFVFIISNLLTSCGTEEEVGEEQLSLSLSSVSVAVGSTVTFNSASSIAGDVTSETTFFVNGTEIDGNTFVPSEVNEANEVYATYNGLTTETMNFASTEVTPSAYTQKVLVEDYTGTWCGNCPRMNTIMHYLTDYSDRIVPTAIHVHGSPTDPWTYEFEEEMTAPENYNIPGAPMGRFNRTHILNMDDSQLCPNDRSVYEAQADVFLNQVAPLGLAINSTLNGNNLNIQIKVGFATDEIPDARLVVNLLEDGLIHEQVNYYSGSGYDCDPEFNYSDMPSHIPNFEHNHVLLKSYTDVFGDEIPAGQISNGGVYERDFDVSLPSSVTNSSNLTIVAFVLGNGGEISNRGVINVQSAPVGVNQDFD
jgi:hypothetical protein